MVDKMTGAGHTVVPWQPYKHDYAGALANHAYTADAGAVSQLWNLNSSDLDH